MTGAGSPELSSLTMVEDPPRVEVTRFSRPNAAGTRLLWLMFLLRRSDLSSSDANDRRDSRVVDEEPDAVATMKLLSTAKKINLITDREARWRCAD